MARCMRITLGLASQQACVATSALDCSWPSGAIFRGRHGRVGAWRAGSAPRWPKACSIACGEAVNVEHGANFGSGRGIQLGDRSDLGMDCLVIGPLTIGNDVMMGPRCVLISSAHASPSTMFR